MRFLTDTGLFEYEEYISLKTINDPNEGYAQFRVPGLERWAADGGIDTRRLPTS